MYLCSLLLSALLLIPAPGSATTAAPNDSRFAVYSHGIRIGEITSHYIRRDEDEHSVVFFASRTRISADFLVTSYSLEGDEEARVGSEGTLSYRKSWRENGVAHQVDGRVTGGGFSCARTTTGQEPRTVIVPREGYDFTTMDCPELRIMREGESLTVRLLDLESCEVVTRRYRWVRSERLTVNGASDFFRVVEFRDRHRSATRWILPATVGVRIARQEGTSAAGSYTVRAVGGTR